MTTGISLNKTGYSSILQTKLPITQTNVNLDQLISQDTISFSNIGNYETNTKSNIFLKQYIEEKAKLANVDLNGIDILISSPQNYSDDFKRKLKHISNDVYQARVLDLFRLLNQDKESVKTHVFQMKISQDDKNTILELKNYFDNYYKVEVNYNGKKYNILHLSEADKKELSNISPQFYKFIQAEEKSLQNITKHFAQKEISKLRLDDAGHNSAIAAGGLATILAFLVAKGVFDSRTDANLLKANKGEFLKNQAEILKEGIPKFENPFKSFVKAGRNGFFKKNAKNPKALVLSALIATSLAGSADDLMGCVKDSIQDVDNFGWIKGLCINIPAALFGIVTSMAIAPMIEGQINYNRAVKYLEKHKNELGKLGLDSKILKNSGGIMKKGGKTALFATIGLIAANAFKGIITAMSSSGSSWGSMFGTRLVMGQGGDKLVKQCIITQEENTIKNTNKNMMAYEAYKGKWIGIAQQDPIIGATGGALGLFTHHNPYIQSLSFGLQGCSETLTACFYQVTGAKDRTSDLEKEKHLLVNSIK